MLGVVDVLAQPINDRRERSMCTVEYGMSGKGIEAISKLENGEEKQ